MNRWLRGGVLIALMLSAAASISYAQKEKLDKLKEKTGSLECNDGWNNDRLVSHCEIQEQTFASPGALAIDSRKNGGISVKGWDRNEVLLRARIQTAAESQALADELAKQIRIQTAGGRIVADGPARQRDMQWSVSYEVFVPRRTDLTLDAFNGGIAISEVTGKLGFTAINGGVVLRRVGGNVHGSTTNGG